MAPHLWRYAQFTLLDHIAEGPATVDKPNQLPE
jgi:hypothetical protein